MKEEEKDCTSCIHFRSFREIYDGDRMEPEEYGWCYYGGGNRYTDSPDGKNDRTIGEGYRCSKHEEEEKTISP